MSMHDIKRRDVRDERAGAPVVVRDSRALGKVNRFFQELGDSGFFGKVTFSFQNGNVCDVKIEQTKKLDDL